MFKYIFNNKNRASIFFVSIIIFLMLALKFTGILEVIELKGYDLLYALKGNIKASPKVVFADIDDPSIKTLGKYPFKRNFYADAIRTLVFLGAKEIVFDIEFPDPSESLLDMQAYQNAINLQNINIETLKKIKLEPDAVFGEEIKKSSRVFIASAFMDKEFEADIKKINEEIKNNIENRVNKYVSTAIELSDDLKSSLYHGKFNSFITKHSFLAATDQFFYYQKGYGYSSTKYDIDGAVRKIPLFLKFVRGDKKYLIPQLSLNAVLDNMGIDKKNILIEPGRFVSFADTVIPISKEGYMLINWAGNWGGDSKDAFTHIPFSNLTRYSEIQKEKDEYILAIAELVGAEEIKQQIDERAALLNVALSDPYNTETLKIYNDFNTEVIESENAILEAIDNVITTNKNSGTADELEFKKIIAVVNECKELNSDLKKLDDFKNAIVYIGWVSTGTTDLGATPVNTDGTYPMVGVHGNIANTILQKEFLVRAETYLNILFIIIAAVLILLFQIKFSARYSIIMTLVTGLASIFIAYILFAKFGYWIDIVAIVTSLVLTTIALNSYNFLNEEKQKKYIKSAFGMYLSPHVIDEMVASGGQVELSGEEKQLTAFFSDIAGFTSISEKLSATELVKLLNEYLTEMCDIIMDCKGTIDKFEGDAIMAFYGAPLSDNLHAFNCCKAALVMQKRLQTLRDEVWGPKNQPLLTVRMGINTGKMRVGNMGSKSRMNYTIMGDAVNLSSRLEGVNKQYKTNIMISEYTYQSVKDEFEFRLLDKIKVVGKNTALDIYELLSFKNELPQTMRDMLKHYYDGKDYYVNKHWNEAINCFDKALGIIPNDGPSQIFKFRCSEYLQHPEKFSEIHSLTEK